jgi:uncharacterized protein (DUF779 family)
MLPERVVCTQEAADVLRQLKERYGPVMFHQSGGCCDGSSPMCFEQGDFKTGEQDVYLGEIEDSPFYITRDQYEYWKHTQLIVDVTQGRGASFSLEIPMGVRFLLRSRLFTEAEFYELDAAGAFA